MGGGGLPLISPSARAPLRFLLAITDNNNNNNNSGYAPMLKGTGKREAPRALATPFARLSPRGKTH